jgi:5-methylcytosine-specific restriction endonuclease McrA
MAEGAKRRAKKLNAMPAWADPGKIRAIYAEARRFTKETGIRHEVDHIHPLQGRTVSGLHVETNLQVITAGKNRRKSNRFRQ